MFEMPLANKFEQSQQPFAHAMARQITPKSRLQIISKRHSTCEHSTITRCLNATHFHVCNSRLKNNLLFCFGAKNIG